MSSSVVFQRLLLDLWAGIRGVPVSLSRGAIGEHLCDCYYRVSRMCTSDWVKPKASVLKGIFSR